MNFAHWKSRGMQGSEVLNFSCCVILVKFDVTETGYGLRGKGRQIFFGVRLASYYGN